jgi:hypothetical protein
MRDARCEMRDARCEMRDARCEIMASYKIEGFGCFHKITQNVNIPYTFCTCNVGGNWCHRC